MSIVQWASANLPEPLLELLRPAYNAIRNTKIKVSGALDRYRVIGPDEIYEENYYSKRKDDPWRSDANCVSEAVYDYFKPRSVIDIGCAIGTHLEYFYEKDVEVKGVEGNSKAFNHAVVPQSYLEQHDLRDPYTPERKYDLAICFEVAEHIPDSYSDTFVDTLSDCSGKIIMTAAKPGQAGTHHVNNQPQDYWREKFADRGYTYDSDAVEHLKRSIEVQKTDHILENIMVFERRG